MTNSLNCSERERLEKLVSLPIGNLENRHSIRLVIQQITQWLVYQFASGNSPHVWQTVDRTGMTYWHFYDPISGRKARNLSEAELRSLIEERYSRSH